MPAKRAVYSTLIGDYETLRELEIPLEPDVDYLMFTDDPNLTSKTWQLVAVEKTWPHDMSRSQRVIKTIGHPRLNEYEATIYVDNNVVLKKPASEIFEQTLVQNDIAIAHHSLRNSLADEFEAVAKSNLDTTARVKEQLSHYQKTWPELLEAKPLWCGMLIRRNTTQVQEFNRIWYEHILRYSRRDQLSVLVALKMAGLAINQLELDHEESQLHRRDHSIRKVSRAQSRATEPDYEAEITQLKKQISTLKSSTSWRITAPLRWLKSLFKQKR